MMTQNLLSKRVKHGKLNSSNAQGGVLFGSYYFLERLTIFLNDIIKAMSNYYFLYLMPAKKGRSCVVFCAEISKNHVLKILKVFFFLCFLFWGIFNLSFFVVIYVKFIICKIVPKRTFFLIKYVQQYCNFPKHVCPPPFPHLMLMTM